MEKMSVSYLTDIIIGLVYSNVQYADVYAPGYGQVNQQILSFLECNSRDFLIISE